jgi:alkylhydroperoxidase family enzyme
MPYMQRITWSGIALHAGILPGYPASHGCIRLTNDFAIRLWHLTKRGTRVIIARDDVLPVEITNPHLFVSKPKTTSGSLESRAITVAGVDTQEVNDSQVAGSAAVGGAPQKVIPISVFVSRKLSRLFVRHGFTPLFDVPVKIHTSLASKFYRDVEHVIVTAALREDIHERHIPSTHRKTARADDVKLAFYFTRRQFGRVLTPLKVHSARLPPAFGMFYGKVAKLDGKLQLRRELTFLIREQVARINMCLFCMDIGRWAAIKESMNEAKFDALEHYSTSTLFTDAERAALDYVTELTKIKDGQSRHLYPAVASLFSTRDL